MNRSQSVAGVDGCKAGWVAVHARLDGAAPPALDVSADFAAILDGPRAPRIVVVDMPIGLPPRTGHGGRGPEGAVRPLLGPRQSSVFSIPARAAVYAERGPFADDRDMRAAHRRASAVARACSDPPRGVAIQAFALFPKIREIDGLMTPALEARVYEGHPEVAFWRLNGNRAMALPKKIKGRPNADGIAERQALLARHGYDRSFLEQALPPGVGRDDLVDAAALARIAARIASGEAESFPAEPQRDEKGLRMAIWA